MASSTTRLFARISSRLQPRAVKLSRNETSMPASLFKSASPSAPKRSLWMPRLPVELSSVQTILPLHSAIASARLRSSLSLDSQSWGLVPQGVPVMPP